MRRPAARSPEVLLHRSYSRQTNSGTGWEPVTEWVDTQRYTDPQVSNTVRYQYRMQPRVAFSTSNGLVQSTEYAYARRAQLREATAKDDPCAPAGSVLINGGAPTMRHWLVDLTLTADDSSPAVDVGINADPDVGTPASDLEMRISNSPDFAGVPWWTFSDTVIDWHLGDVPIGREATVYVQFGDDSVRGESGVPADRDEGVGGLGARAETGWSYETSVLLLRKPSHGLVVGPLEGAEIPPLHCASLRFGRNDRKASSFRPEWHRLERPSGWNVPAAETSQLSAMAFLEMRVTGAAESARGQRSNEVVNDHLVTGDVSDAARGAGRPDSV